MAGGGHCNMSHYANYKIKTPVSFVQYRHELATSPKLVGTLFCFQQWTARVAFLQGPVDVVYLRYHDVGTRPEPCRLSASLAPKFCDTDPCHQEFAPVGWKRS